MSPTRSRSSGGRRRLALAGCAIAVLLLLASCATESAKDQERGRQQDASKTAVIAQVQARSAASPFAATPTVMITPTPVAIIGSLTLTIGVGADNSPSQPVGSFSTGMGSVYIAAQFQNLRPGETVTASWRTPDDSEIASSSTTVKSAADGQWIAFPLKTRLQPGEYAVYILVNNDILNSLVFNVSG